MRNDRSRGARPVLLGLHLHRGQVGAVGRLGELRRAGDQVAEVSIIARRIVLCIGSGKVILELVRTLLLSRGERTEPLLGSDQAAVRRSSPGLENSILELSSPELASSGSLLLEDLLFLGVCVADLNDMIFSVRNSNRSIVELLDDVLADIARLKASEANTTTVATAVTEDFAGADLVRMED